ncbi:MAG: TatD family hydrolase [Patescibacteria group bacterium]
MLIDSHCHPQFPQYDSDREEVIKRALDGGVRIICVGTDLEKSKQAIELAEKYDGVWATVGLHPNDRSENFQIADYEKLLGHPKVVAIGEVGLDYYRTPESEKQKLQRGVLQQFLTLATEVKLPLIVHCRNAHADMLAMFRASSSMFHGVVHSFTGTWEQAQQYIDLGFYIGLNGIITFSDQYREMIEKIPLDRILLETDAPYLTPTPYRGKRNEPFYITTVAQKIAELKQIPLEQVAEITTQNAEKFFKISDSSR